MVASDGPAVSRRAHAGGGAVGGGRGVTRVLDTADPARGEEAGEFQGRLLGASVSVIVVDAPPAGGQVVVVPAGVAHKFVNSGAGRLRQVDIHASDHFVTEWLE